MVRDGGKRHFVILIILLMVATGAVGLYFWRTALENRVEDLRDAIEFVQSQYHFATMYIQEKSDSTILFDLSMFNLSEELIGTDSYEIEGSDIFLESRVAVMAWEEDTRAFVFPTTLFSDSVPSSQGISITNLYVDKNIPMNYIVDDMKVSMKLAMKNIFQVVFGEEIYDPQIEEQYFERVFDTAVHQSVIQPFREGKSYHFIIHPNGGVEIVEASYGS